MLIPRHRLIAHKTREIRAALTNNCFYVYHQPAPPAEAAAPPQRHRVSHTRTQAGQLQVLYLQTGRWHPVAANDTLFHE